MQAGTYGTCPEGSSAVVHRIAAICARISSRAADRRRASVGSRRAPLRRVRRRGGGTRPRCRAHAPRSGGRPGRADERPGVRPRHRAGADGAPPDLVVGAPHPRAVGRRLDVPRRRTTASTRRSTSRSISGRSSPSARTSGATSSGSCAPGSARSRRRRIETSDERVAWFVLVATIPAGVIGLARRGRDRRPPRRAVADPHPARGRSAPPVVGGSLAADARRWATSGSGTRSSWGSRRRSRSHPASRARGSRSRPAAS